MHFGPLVNKSWDNMENIIDKIELFVLDMDGTFYLGDKMIEGSDLFMQKVKECGKRAVFFTNNSSKNKKMYVEKLAGMGCIVTGQDIMTSGDVTAQFLKRERPGKKVFLMGTPALHDCFADAGIPMTEAEDECDIVVLGFDMTLTYEKLERGCTFIRNGAEFIATHPDINCPTETGFIPDCGAMIAMMSLSTGVEPRVLGKPNKETADMVSEVFGVDKDKIAFVGDRLYTDVACGVKNGAHGILVLSGEGTMKDVEESEVKPDMIFERIGAICECLR